MNLLEAMDQLKEKGYKHTGKREEMLRLFSREKRYISAKDVLEAMNLQYPGLSFDTIYRNLSLFAQLNILETTELDGEKKFRFRCSTQEHHHHLICLDCGKTKHIKSCPMELIKSHKTFSDFEVTGHKFEIYGRCNQCQP
ncbi:Fur family transcriptional regulator [Alkalihalobacillus trypoxylicola]|uniref:Fur family transcriptional regulator n=1 Tax=Alkalihalobacillus trypoxylicola TaxID=519424 RepID=A0A161QNT2_9BACI|nr:Fur family transcriptional regulator [Alkalihalobacillus trypoxylicola]KYG32063.1 Fur family transcriptional regulator [Alkalihalobacillus trypoxylicola]